MAEDLLPLIGVNIDRNEDSSDSGAYLIQSSNQSLSSLYPGRNVTAVAYGQLCIALSKK